jgi:hypothetical protein
MSSRVNILEDALLITSQKYLDILPFRWEVVDLCFIYNLSNFYLYNIMLFTNDFNLIITIPLNIKEVST